MTSVASVEFLAFLKGLQTKDLGEASYKKIAAMFHHNHAFEAMDLMGYEYAELTKGLAFVASRYVCGVCAPCCASEAFQLNAVEKACCRIAITTANAQLKAAFVGGASAAAQCEVRCSLVLRLFGIRLALLFATGRMGLAVPSVL